MVRYYPSNVICDYLHHNIFQNCYCFDEVVSLDLQCIQVDKISRGTLIYARKYIANKLCHNPLCVQLSGEANICYYVDSNSHTRYVFNCRGKQRYVISLIVIPTRKWYIQMMLIKLRALICSIWQYHCNDAMYQGFSYCFIVLIRQKWSERSHLMPRSLFLSEPFKLFDLTLYNSLSDKRLLPSATSM